MWSTLLKRVFAVDGFECPLCDQPIRLPAGGTSAGDAAGARRSRASMPGSATAGVCSTEPWVPTRCVGRDSCVRGLIGAAWRLFSVETRRLALSKSAVNHYLRATMAFKQARFWTDGSYLSTCRMRCLRGGEYLAKCSNAAYPRTGSGLGLRGSSCTNVSFWRDMRPTRWCKLSDVEPICGAG
jgi:hypothetical protein